MDHERRRRQLFRLARAQLMHLPKALVALAQQCRDFGELLIRSPYVCLGYHNAPEITRSPSISHGVVQMPVSPIATLAAIAERHHDPPRGREAGRDPP